MDPVVCFLVSVPEDLDPELSYQLAEDPIFGLTERERRFGEAYFEVALEHGDNASSLLLSYRRAFPVAGNDDRAASMLSRHLIKSPRVQVLLARLREALSHRRLIPAERTAQELERIAYANVLDYTSIEENGDLRIDMTRLTPATAAAISEITVDETYDPRTEKTHRRIKLKMYDKLSALDKLARAHRIYPDNVNPNLSLEDLDRVIQRMERQLEDRGVTIDHEAPEAVLIDASGGVTGP